MLHCDIDTTGKQVAVQAGGSFEMVAVNIIQIVRVVYDQIKNANPEAAQYFRDGFTNMINNERTWGVDTLGTTGRAEASVLFFEKGGGDGG